ncbi:MAG TPA: sigma-70 family RNA polymerase sigma factor [Polyangiaceae bacterium]|jgi:RNA polymerase sigma factor (sigma-70 family)|nr:sigma-70 family RNA polymerase sigma factor [Polyangiaceae bacterium]
MNGDEADWVQAFRNGRREALERVYREHRRSIETLVRTSLRRADMLTRHDHADLVQDIFARAFSPKARESFDGVRRLGPFLRQIARNLLIDWLRHQTYELQGRAELERAAAPTASESAASAYSEALVAAARTFVADLAPELRAVHERRFVAAETQENAARTLGISRQNLRTIERRLLDGLRALLSAPRGHEPAVGRVRHTGRPCSADRPSTRGAQPETKPRRRRRPPKSTHDRDLMPPGEAPRDESARGAASAEP